jgi:micrococcal nuclease
MIQHGHAWCYRKYNRNPKFIEAEENAKSKKIGLWSLKEKNVAPWEWRKKSAK